MIDAVVVRKMLASLEALRNQAIHLSHQEQDLERAKIHMAYACRVSNLLFKFRKLQLREPATSATVAGFESRAATERI